jgi:RsiW-degrading membrane proteinase PrsW (M82 family)
MVSLLIAAVAPALFLLHYVYVRDKYRRAQAGRVVAVYLVSFLGVLPAGIWELNVPHWQALGLAGVAFATWGIVAAAEEGMKYAFLRWLAVPHATFTEVYDGVLYGTAVSLGFATAENIMYVLIYGHGDLTVALLRGVLSVPGHATWGIMLGYFVGLARFAPRAAQPRLALTGWALAAFWHGLYDFLAFTSDLPGNPWRDYCAVGVVGVVIVGWVIGTYLLHRAQQLSAYKRPSFFANPIGALVQARYCNRCGTPCSVAASSCPVCSYEFPLPPAVAS